MKEHPYPIYIDSKMPLSIPDMRWFVHEGYEIKVEEEKTIGADFDSQYFNSTTVSSTLYENFEAEESLKSQIYFPPGKYICWIDNFKKSYNPFEESSNLLRKFLRLGYGDVPDRMVLVFSKKYGVLKDVENHGTSLKGGFLYKKYPVNALKRYAREAYRVKNLHELLSNLDIEAIRKELKDIGDYIPGGFDAIANPIKTKNSFRLDFGEYISSWWHKVPSSLRRHLLEIIPGYEEISVAKAGQKLDDESKRTPMVFMMLELTKEFWEAFTSLASNEMITDFTQLLISEILKIRLWEGITIKPQMMRGSSELDLTYEYLMKPDSLLTAIWLLLYLEITSQEAYYYRECEYCGKKNFKKPGEKIYKGNVFCDVNCRNNSYFHDVQGVIEMGRAGFPLDLIKDAYPRREEESIIKWLNKEGLEVNIS